MWILLITNIFPNARMLPSLITNIITNKDWTWNIKKCFTKVNGKININIQTKKTQIYKHNWKSYLKKQLDSGSSSSLWNLQLESKWGKESNWQAITRRAKQHTWELGSKGTWVRRNQTIVKGTSNNVQKAKQQYTRNCMLMTTMQEDPNNNTKRPKQQWHNRTI
jgi:hypothetical protein